MQHVNRTNDHTKRKKMLECNCRRKTLSQHTTTTVNMCATNGKRSFGNRVTPTVNEQYQLVKKNWIEVPSVKYILFSFFLLIIYPFSFSTSIVHFTFHSKKYISLFSSQIPSKTRTLASSARSIHIHEIQKW